MRARQETWETRWAREVAKWKATPTGKATTAMYEAAEKAGFASELRRMGVELIVETWNGKTSFQCFWDREKTEDPEFVFNEAVFARAEEWSKKYAAKQGWEA